MSRETCRQEQGAPDWFHVQARAEEPTQLVVLSLAVLVVVLAFFPKDGGSRLREDCVC